MDKVKAFFSKVASNPQVRKKLWATLFIFFIARAFVAVPVPGIDTAQLSALFDDNQFLGMLNVFAGGTLATFSLVALGVSPYITSSIVFQLLAMVFPKLKELQKDGERGKAKLNQYTKLASLPIAIVQSISMIVLLQSQNLLTTDSIFSIVTIVISLVAGAFIMLWFGELITAHGLGNGVSMMMVLGIISQFPTQVMQLFAAAPGFSVIEYIITIAIFVGILLVIGLVIYINEARRNVPIQYAKRMHGNRVSGGQRTFFPIKVNSVGVMPIIFAVTMMSFPSFLGGVLSTFQNETLSNFGQQITMLFNEESLFYMGFYFAIVFAFSYFSAIIFFNAEDISNELKKSGAFVPGIRPGSQTKNFLAAVVQRLTFIDAIFLGFIAVMPFLLQRLTGIGALAIGGTSLLILVSVLLEMNKSVEGMAVAQNYDQFQV
ncbi:MAG: preprotein translocase subunit SecY [Pseudomonadales bacterium]|jgi:preprotein translocase subunit SecY|nr:preprotein translocase subunit SecY [Pseudomonadales bacterium]